MTAKTPIYGIEYLVQGEPIRATRLALENNAKTVEAALQARGVAAPNAADLLAVSGRVTKLEDKIRAVARQTAGGPVPGAAASTWALMTWQAAGVDRDTHHGFVWNTGAGTSGTKFTNVSSGPRTLIVSVKAMFAGPVQATCRILKNGAPIPDSGGQYNTGVFGVITGPKMVDLNPGDYIEAQAWCSTAGWATFIDPNVGPSSLTIYEL